MHAPKLVALWAKRIDIRSKFMQNEFRISVPKLPNKIQETAQIRDVSLLLSSIDSLFYAPNSCFGFDHKIQYHLEENNFKTNTRKPFFRLSQEPIILSYWTRLSNFAFDETSALSLASALCASAIRFRTSDIWALGFEDRKILFRKAEDIGRFIPDLHKVRSLRLPGIVEAIISYAIVISIHPFKDGNGRFARAVFYGALANRDLIRSPCLGIGSTFDYMREDLARSIIKLSESQDWITYIEDVSITLEQCLLLARAVRSEELHL